MGEREGERWGGGRREGGTEGEEAGANLEHKNYLPEKETIKNISLQ